MSTFRHNLTLTVFGESHGPEVGMILSGLPAGFAVDMDELCAFLSRRAPGSGETGTTARKEGDIPVFRSGLEQGVTTGEPITAVIPNTDIRSGDYAFSHTPRPGHADYTAWVKGGEEAVRPGGGRFSGRLTAPICVAGGICRQLLARQGVSVTSRLVSVGNLTEPEAMEAELADCRRRGDSVGAVVECEIHGLPAGLGDCLFDGMESTIAALAFGIPGVKGVEFGAGFAAAGMHGSEHNDPFAYENGRVITKTNHAGGILGGITTGMPLVFRCAFKPTPSIAMEQDTVELRRRENTKITVSGRHDVCIALRGRPVTEAVAAIAVMDAMEMRNAECGMRNTEIRNSEFGIRNTEMHNSEFGMRNNTIERRELAACREEIDAIDREMLTLFARRMAVAGDIAACKKARGLPVRDPVREAQKLSAVAAQVPPELSDSAKRLYEALFALTRERERDLMEDRPC